MSTTCNSYRSTVCRTGLQTVDNTCSCLNYQLSPPFVSFGAAGMQSDFGSYVAGATLPLTPVAQSLIQERTSLVRGDGQLVAAKTPQLPCGPGTKPCPRTRSCVPADAPNTMWPQAPYN
jgi:hypothetical protein